MSKSRASSWECALCQDKKFLRSNVEPGEPGFGSIAPCPRCNAPARDALCGLTPEERQITFEKMILRGKPGTDAMVKALKAFAAQPTGLLSVFGSYGNGKSTAIAATINALVERGIDARYTTALALIGYVKDGISADGDFTRLNRLAGVQVLFVDEADKLVQQTDYVVQIQTHFMDVRYRNAARLGTVLAWNGSMAAWNGLPWVRSRLLEYPCIENWDADMRLAIGKARQDAKN